MHRLMKTKIQMLRKNAQLTHFSSVKTHLLSLFFAQEKLFWPAFMLKDALFKYVCPII